MSDRAIGFHLAGVLAAAAAVGGFALLALTRASATRAEAQSREHELSLGPRVETAVVGRSPPFRTVKVQGEARPYASVTLYAKVSGYLRDIRVDKGDRVKRGQILARIEAPEIDQQYLAAAATARTSRANAERAGTLVGPGVVSHQDYDNAVATSDSAEATRRAWQQQKDYEWLRAPFDGTITARFADPGALVQAATAAQTSALPVVEVSKVDRLRVYAYVDQRDAPFVHVGDAASVVLPERPGTQFRAPVSRLSDALDPRTRTLLVEVDLDNHAGLVVPGSFVEVALELPVPSLPEVPDTALVFRERSAFVGVVGADDRVQFRPVTVADDDGIRARVSSGLSVGERVALNLGDEVGDGSVVRPAAPEGTHATPAR